MSSGKPKTPVSSPKIPRSVRLSSPTTPPSSSRGKQKRLSSNFLKTPEQSIETLPYSPSLKRTNSGNYKSPDYKLNSKNVSSPYNASSLLKTPRHTGYDSDDNNGENSRSKLQKTPKYFSPARKLFDDGANPMSNDEKNAKEDLSEISLQLRSKLSNALGKIQQKEKPGKINFTELTIDTSPTKKFRNGSSSTWSPSTSIQKANINLQTLQHSPLPNGNSSHGVQTSQTTVHSESPLKQSPIITRNTDKGEISLPSPDEESSAHNALMAALSRQRKKSRSSSGHGNLRPNLLDLSSTHTPQQASQTKLPPINMVLNSQNEESTEPGSANNEQDAVLSLMSLSSPQSVKFSHSRTHSLNKDSAISSRSSSVIGTSPTNAHLQPILPPISGIMATPKKNEDTDNDETDVDDDVTDEEPDNKLV